LHLVTKGKNMSLAPICLFCYNRLDKLQKTVAALQTNYLASDSDLFIFSDGPKTPQDADAIKMVRNYLNTIQGFKSVNIRIATNNQGLDPSIISGVTEIVNRFGKVIVVEDDLLTSPFFLQFMNDGLDAYADVDSVGSITGYAYPLSGEIPETYFIKGAEGWSWATWKRAWNFFESYGQKLLNTLIERNLSYEFDFNGSFPYMEMLQNKNGDEFLPWDVCWYASSFLANKLVLYPRESLVQNIGMDGTGTHCNATNKYATKLTQHRIQIIPTPPPRKSPSTPSYGESFYESLQMLGNSGNYSQKSNRRTTSHYSFQPN